MTARGEHERACARVAAHARRGWMRYYTAAKLRSDPVFPAAYELFSENDEPILDVGCGIGLLAAYLRERGCRQALIGVDRDARKIALASNMSARATYRDVEWHVADIAEMRLQFSGNVAAFDVLHYLQPHEQQRLLRSLAECVALDGVVAVREAPRDGSVRFAATYLGEKFAQAVKWNVATPLHFPSVENMRAAFSPSRFHSEARPLWGGTPFNNHLFIFRLRKSAAVVAPVSHTDSRARSPSRA